MKTSQSGNMLVYILGAIFLMGILLVALRSGYQPGAGIDAESAMLKAAQIQKYASELERGVGFIMNNGRSETDVRFAHASAAGGYGTPGDTPVRQVFEPNGGGVEWQAPPSGSQTVTTAWVFSGANAAAGVGSTCAAASCSDLIAILPNVTKEICITLNNNAGVTNPSTSPPVETGNVNSSTLFSGTFTYAQDIAVTGGHTFAKKEGCYEGGGTPAAGTFHYYRVLMAR